MNPEIRRVADEELGGCERIRITPPFEPVDFHSALSRSYIILTDSGGIQEEATALGKPTLVLRDTTERPEGIVAGTLRLVGTEELAIYTAFTRLLDSREEYVKMAGESDSYGDGSASKRIADIIEEK